MIADFIDLLLKWSPSEVAPTLDTAAVVRVGRTVIAVTVPANCCEDRGIANDRSSSVVVERHVEAPSGLAWCRIC